MLGVRDQGFRVSGSARRSVRIRGLLETMPQQLLEANAMLLLAGLEKDVSRMDKVYKEHKDTYMGKYALQQQFMYWFHDEDNKEQTRAVLNQMDEVYSPEIVTYEAHALMGDDVVAGFAAGISSAIIWQLVLKGQALF